ncbi:hypothetical protein FG386_002595, partial [Cryptosporidium ryanae]|uniref:uncharacterized protein n=1 Tax=Cryptosporidium ryanae TaxID=515981 RepID=UPI003519E292
MSLSKHKISDKLHNEDKNIRKHNMIIDERLKNKDNNSEYIVIHSDINNKINRSKEASLYLHELNIVQRRTSKSLLRVKYRNDRILLVFFFVGMLGLPIISWSLGWIIGKTLIRPKSHKGEKLRQLNGTLTILCIIIVGLFSIFYIQSSVSSEYSTNTLFIQEINESENKLKETINISKQQNKQILSCSSDTDIELLYWKQSSEIEKGLVLFIGKLLVDTWYNSKVLESAYKNEFTVAAINPPGYGKSSKLIGNNNVTNSSYLYWLISSCLNFEVKKTVIVTHSNSITQKYVIPLIMNYQVSGIVFFNTNMGIKWFNAKNPLINDHYYYQPLNFNDTIIRYIGDKKQILYSSNQSSENTNVQKELKKNGNTRKKVDQQVTIPTKTKKITTSTSYTSTTSTSTITSSISTATVTQGLEQMINDFDTLEKENTKIDEITEVDEVPTNNEEMVNENENSINHKSNLETNEILNELSNSLISSIENTNNQNTENNESGFYTSSRTNNTYLKSDTIKNSTVPSKIKPTNST